MTHKYLIVIAGPTAVGKTNLAIRLAETLKTEIISADSRQVYKDLDIGTAKPEAKDLQRVKHHFINHKPPQEEYNAGTFGREARATADGLFAKYDHVILSGGSGLYIKAFLEGFDDIPEVSAEIRKKINTEYNLRGLPWIQKEVAASDPDYFEVVDKKNPQRLIRALEIIRATGKAFSSFHKKEKVQLPFGVIKIGLELDRKTLYERIDLRMDSMLENGLFKEAQKFFELRHLSALQTVGYQEVFGFLEGKCDRDEAVRLMKRNSRRYAKRQFTWFKKDKEIKWFSPGDWNGIMDEIGRRLSI